MRAIHELLIKYQSDQTMEIQQMGPVVTKHEWISRLKAINHASVVDADGGKWNVTIYPYLLFQGTLAPNVIPLEPARGMFGIIDGSAAQKMKTWQREFPNEEIYCLWVHDPEQSEDEFMGLMQSVPASWLTKPIAFLQSRYQEIKDTWNGINQEYLSLKTALLARGVQFSTLDKTNIP